MIADSSENSFTLEWRDKMATVYTAIPCIVLAVVSDLKTQTVDVRPSIDVLWKDEVYTEHPQIMGVPVVFPASSTSGFTFPISVGDTVLCVFSQRGLDNFKMGNGYPSSPTDYRRFDKRDAIAIPGLFPSKKAINNPTKHNYTHSTYDAVMFHNVGTGNECEVRLKENGDIYIRTAKDVYVAGDNVDVTATSATLTASSLTANVDSTTWNGTFTLDGIELNTHVHGSVQSGLSKTGEPE